MGIQVLDPTGYTIDFNLYTGKEEDRTDHGVSYDVVMKLVQPYAFQGYSALFDNSYSSPKLLEDLLTLEITGTGTLRANQRGIPTEVKELKSSLEKGKNVPRGTGYYLREEGSQVVYVCWQDRCCVLLASTAYPGHSEGTVACKQKTGDGGRAAIQVTCPAVVKAYNKYKGGVPGGSISELPQHPEENCPILENSFLSSGGLVCREYLHSV